MQNAFCNTFKRYSVQNVFGKPIFEVLFKWPLKTGFTYMHTVNTTEINHARIQEYFFRGGGAGVQARRPENSRDNVVFFFFFLFCLVPNVFYSLQRGSNGFIIEKTILFQGIQMGANIFQGRPTFSYTNFYRNPYNV